MRRLAEGIAGSLPGLAVLALPVMLGMGYVYQWAGGEAPAGEAFRPPAKKKKPRLV